MTKFSASYLCDVVYGIEPMTRELALAVRALRVTQRLSYAAVGDALCKQGADGSAGFQLGQSLSQMAAAFLHEINQDGWT